MKFKVKKEELINLVTDKTEYKILPDEFILEGEPTTDTGMLSDEEWSQKWCPVCKSKNKEKPQPIEEIPQDAIQKVRNYSGSTIMMVLKVLGIIIDKLNEFTRAINKINKVND